MSAKKGDEAALTHLLALARDVLLRDLRPRLSGGWTEDWLEDVVQEALIDICVHHGTCRARTLGELVAWVKAIGRREAATLHRNNAKWVEACAAAALGNDTGTTSCSDTPSAASEALRSRLRTLGPTSTPALTES